MIADDEGLEERRLAQSLVRLIDSARHRMMAEDPSELVTRITEHLGCELAAIPNVSITFEGWEQVNLHRGVTAYLERWSPEAEWFGLTGQMHGMQNLMDILAMAGRHGMFQLGAVEYTTAATGPDTAVEVIQFGLVATRAPSGKPAVINIRGPVEHSPQSQCALRVLAADRETATAVRAEVEELVQAHNVFRSQLLQFDVSENRGNELVSFLPRPEVSAGDVVLPAGVLEAVERHVVRDAAASARLREHGQHLKRGVLLYGPPGTGKTHTVRYLMSKLTDATVTVLSGRALTKLVPSAVSLARRFQPSVVVIEDVDLIAEDRSFSDGATPVLFELLNRIDGVDADTDITFILTTNRVDTVERALVDRPGRIDLAVEIPKPDAEGRERLIRLYAAETELDLPDVSELVAATEGVTASFIRELVRRAILGQMEHTTSGRVTLDAPALRRALDGLFDERNSLTSSILGRTQRAT
ncbi:AAA family ATPase [Amycolatopsis nigrescens]|uniref:AAA family ATPase n=1 Tax=Amycolatopsis nigrescens TaxID=381445 RepID=UPI00058F45F8|nr:ATP-binding protein [Amycolatopsis nigrescens]